MAGESTFRFQSLEPKRCFCVLFDFSQLGLLQAKRRNELVIIASHVPLVVAPILTGVPYCASYNAELFKPLSSVMVQILKQRFCA